MDTDNKALAVIIEDEQAMRSLLEDYLLQEKLSVRSFANAAAAMKFMEQNASSVDLIISDIKMPGMSGLEFTEVATKKFPKIPVIIMTSFGSIESAIEAIRAGAFDYITKPFKFADMQVAIHRALKFRNLQIENQILKKESKRNWSLGKIIGKSNLMQKLFQTVERIAKADTTVLIQGESGTGKEVIARAIHNHSNRNQKPFLAINCSAIPEALLESELFGHVKGAFTGADRNKIGMFEEAQGGTLLLDEIGDMPISLQAKILRVLQEKTIRPVGGNQSKKVDVRILAATHKNLKDAIKNNEFREDLYYRLSVIPLQIPSLRERKVDIPLLVNHFLKKCAEKNPNSVDKISKAAMSQLMQHQWPGNVRELENFIERSCLLCPNEQIEVDDIKFDETSTVESFFEEMSNELPTIEKLEKRYIKIVLDKFAGKKGKVAKVLGINRRTLYRKEREYGFVKESSSYETDQ